ncbi:MAG: hypothetical protein R2777_05760, partial [Chitinophagales bacterium]
MILFFKGQYQDFYAVQTQIKLSEQDIEKLQWLFGEATALNTTNIVADKGYFVGPRATMVSPWSTNA